MKPYPRISIITPSYNDAKYLEQTIVSVIGQGYPNLEYVVIDGGSTDGSLEVIKKYERNISYWVSEKDAGMYHAIQKGFEISTGDIMGWINSDDKHQPGSLFTIAQIFADHQDINWIQGTPTLIDEVDRIYTDPHPYEVDRFFFYLRKHSWTHKFIQQESTFWRRSLWVKAGNYISSKYRFAGDFELWIRFFKYERLYHVNAVLGSFRHTRGGQASMDHYKEYLEESYQILEDHPLTPIEAKKLRVFNVMEKIFGRFERAYRKLLDSYRAPSILRNKLYFDPREQKLRKW